MRMKIFSADTMPEAIRMVRDALGEDAIIISSHRGDNGRGIRVTAIAGQDDEEGQAPPGQPLAAIEAIAHTLDRHGTPADLSERLMNAAAPLAERLRHAASALSVDVLLMTLAAAIDSTFKFHPLPERDPTRPILLMGPPGSGKTVSVAKLAARAVLSNRPVHVITTDTMRAGGIDQLAAFTRILALDLQTALDGDALRDAITAATVADEDALVLIDTAGANPHNPSEMAELGTLLRGVSVERVLVVPAGYDCEEAREIAVAFKAVGAERLLATRLDAARRLGSLLAAADTGELAFCDLSATPHVAEGLLPLNPVSLARFLLPQAPRPARAETVGTAEEEERSDESSPAERDDEPLGFSERELEMADL